MNTKALIWVIFGGILILGGLMLSVREGQEIESRGPRPVVVPRAIVPASVPSGDPASSGDTRASGDMFLFPDGNRNMSPEKKFDTGFVIDPIRGLKRKDENAEYFK